MKIVAKDHEADTESWLSSFRQLAERALGRQAGSQLWQKYATAFPAEYQALVPPRYAIKDSLHLEQVLASRPAGHQPC